MTGAARSLLLALWLGAVAAGCSASADRTAPAIAPARTEPLESETHSGSVASSSPESFEPLATSDAPALVEPPTPPRMVASVAPQRPSAPPPEELERLRGIRLKSADKLWMTVRVRGARREGSPSRAIVTVTSPRKEDDVDSRAFRVKVSRLGSKVVVFDWQPTLVSPAPGSDWQGEQALSPSAKVKIWLGVLDPGGYRLTLEYFSEVGVRASILEQTFFIPKPTLPNLHHGVIDSPWAPVPKDEDDE